MCSRPPPTKAASLEALNLALASLVAHGLTAIHDPGIGLDQLALLKEAVDNGTFPIRSVAAAPARRARARVAHPRARATHPHAAHQLLLPRCCAVRDGARAEQQPRRAGHARHGQA